MDKPILFSGPMVRAILAGDKTQTRRVLKAMPGKQSKWLTPELINASPVAKIVPVSAEVTQPLGVSLEHPRGGPLGWIKLSYSVGMHLWVRETFFDHGKGDIDADNIDVETRVEYKATPWDRLADDAGPWTPSIFMPRLYSRITLEVLSVRVERLQSIGDADIVAEGVLDTAYIASIADIVSGKPNWAEWSIRDRFVHLWDSINAKRGYSWSSNPWVIVLEFKRV